MKKGRIFFLIFLLAFSFSHRISFAQNSSNAGFIPSNIWYSKDPFEEGDNIKIYTLVFNPDSRQLSGSVLFFDNDVLLGKKTFVAGASQVAQVGLSWKATLGDHVIFAKIENTKFLTSSGSSVDVYLAENESDKSKRTVNKKILNQVNDSISNAKDTAQSVATSADTQATSIADTIKEKTPDFIAKPILYVANGIESFRESTDNKISNTKDKIKADIQKIKDSVNGTTANAKTSGKNALSKPFEYVKLFFTAILSAILDFKILFYGLSALLLFFIFRFIWRKIFGK